MTAPVVAPSLAPVSKPSVTPPLWLAHTDWLYHHLDIEGPAAALSVFVSRAAGSGAIPWRLDLDQIEEDAFHTLALAGALSLDGAAILAGQLREAVGRRHRLAVGRVGGSGRCPFDLHILRPVPDDILALGPNHPDVLAWLWASWGTTDALRHVSRRRSCTPTCLQLAFWSADWTPWRALEALRTDWPELRFTVRPLYSRD